MRHWREGRVRVVERIADATEADARVLDHLAKLGCNPSEPRECRHYVYVAAEPGARALAGELNRDDGWFADCEELRDSWLVTATIFMGLTDDLVRATRRRLEQLASHHGGEYDGWEAAAD